MRQTRKNLIFQNSKQRRMKSKYVAATLAFFVGIFGTHRFYLGQRFLGVLYAFIFFVTIMITVEEGVPAIAFPAILAFVDSILLSVMPKEEFDERYNRRYIRQRRRRPERTDYERAPRTNPSANRTTSSELKRRGIEKFRDYDYEGAIEDFLQAIDIQPDDPATHFNLACSYSILEESEVAFEHLDLAVAHGFNQFDKIKNHDALSFIRTQPEFDKFVKNDYRLPKTERAPEVERFELKQEKPASPPAAKEEKLVLEDELLDQIIKLGQLRDKGILTEDEFYAQKQKILAKR